MLLLFCCLLLLKHLDASGHCDLHFTAHHQLYFVGSLLAAENMNNNRPISIGLPLCSHVPSLEITGSIRWTFSLDAQAFPTTHHLGLSDILLWATLYLNQNDRAATISVWITLQDMAPSMAHFGKHAHGLLSVADVGVFVH
jgi:hypothetical protein